MSKLWEMAAPTDQTAVILASRVLVEMGYLAAPLEQPNLKQPVKATTDGIAPEWIEWCDRWNRTATQGKRTREATYSLLLKAGRWLAEHHPDVTSPLDWTRDLAVEFVAAVDRMLVGEYVSKACHMSQSRIGQPLMPRSKQGLIKALSVFFRDCHDWEWIPIRFDPKRYLATPKSVSGQIGTNPRVLADDVWAKLLWAGLNLSEADLPAIYVYTNRYPFELIRAVTIVWLFAGLRLNEIRRLRVGCSRWQSPLMDNGTEPQGERICLLDVPITKSSRALTKPVAAVVGEAISEWEAVRPEQPPLDDPKTGELVHMLFAYRGKLMGHNFVNVAVVPILCEKAGVPEYDARGKITSHRARATIASQLVNTRNPLSLFELQQWLGHQTPNATQHYVSLTPTKLAQSYREAGYFDRNLRTISVLIDQDVIRNGAASEGAIWRYYDLGHGYCTYDFFDQCPHRMACAKCDFYLAKKSSQAQLLEAREHLQRMLQEIPLTTDEQLAVEDGIGAVENLQQRLIDVPTPSGQTPRQLQSVESFIPLNEIVIHNHRVTQKE